MVSSFREDLNKRLQDPQFAKDFGSEVAKTAFAVILAKTRKYRGVTQDDLAKKLDVKQSYIAKLERGDANPTLGMAGKTLAVLGMRLQTDAAPLTLESSFTTKQYCIPHSRYGIARMPQTHVLRKHWMGMEITRKVLVLG
jgi:transcriptional regulator with XRE-family HTH domain